MPPIPVMPTETLVSCAKTGWADATKTSAANRSALTIHHDLRTARGWSILGSIQIDTAAFHLGSSSALRHGV
jgi:hypothetical protein